MPVNINRIIYVCLIREIYGIDKKTSDMLIFNPFNSIYGAT